MPNLKWVQLLSIPQYVLMASKEKTFPYNEQLKIRTSTASSFLT